MATTRIVAGWGVMIQVEENMELDRCMCRIMKVTTINMIQEETDSIVLGEGWMAMSLMDTVTGTGKGMYIGTDRNSRDFHSQSFQSSMEAVLGRASLLPLAKCAYIMTSASRTWWNLGSR